MVEHQYLFPLFFVVAEKRSGPVPDTIHPRLTQAPGGLSLQDKAGGLSLQDKE